MHFTKLQGAGNDYIFVDGLDEQRDWPEMAPAGVRPALRHRCRRSHRRRAVGARARADVDIQRRRLRGRDVRQRHPLLRQVRAGARHGSRQRQHAGRGDRRGRAKHHAALARRPRRRRTREHGRAHPPRRGRAGRRLADGLQRLRGGWTSHSSNRSDCAPRTWRSTLRWRRTASRSCSLRSRWATRT